MEKKVQQAGLWSLLIAGLAGAAYLPYRSAPAAPVDRGGSGAVPVAAEAARDAQPGDALILLGQYFGLDISDGGLRRRLLAAGRNLNTDPPRAPLPCQPARRAWPAETSASVRSACQDLELLETFFSLDIEPRTRNLEQARCAFKTVSACMKDGNASACARAVARADRATVRAFLRDHLDEEAFRVDNAPLDDRRRAADFSRLNRQELGQIEIAHAVRLQGAPLSFLIATVPDGVDSFAGWSFDPAVDAIRLAAEHSGYVMDRFFVPDWSQRPAASSASGRVHEEQPGAMIFRATSGTDRPVLVVLLALESPTGGVHAVAMDRAIRLASWWQDPGGDAELRILGPFYSGTTPSIQQALRRTMPSLGGRVKHVRIISGSATRSDNKTSFEDLKRELDSVDVTFEATTRPDDNRDLRKRLCEQFHVTRMAWLTESNTDYGANPAAAGGECRGETDLEFKFPLHISRLRDLTPGAPADRPTAGAPLIPLVLREAFTPTDAFPSLSPTLTSASAEMMVRNIGRLIARERILVVGITATDARDKLFLARAIKQIQPSVSFVTTEANLLYSHPDYADSVRGMLVASSYPLTSFVVESGEPHRPAQRVSFPSGAAEGIYNAGLVLMNSYKDGRLVRRLDATRALYPYGREPGAPGPRRPSLWFSQVGREDTWPMRRYSTTANKYTLSVNGPTPAPPTDRELRRVHPGVRLAYLIFVGVVILHIVAFATGHPRWMRKFASRTGQALAGRAPASARLAYVFGMSSRTTSHWNGPLKRKNQGGRYRRQLACFASLLMVFGTCAALQRVWASELGAGAAMISWLSTCLAACLAIICAISAIRILVKLPALQGQFSKFWAERILYSSLVFGLSAWCIWSWMGYAGRLLNVGGELPESGALAIERYVRLSNGLSPVLPLMLIAAAVYLWGYLDLTGYPIPGHRRFDDTMQVLNGLLDKDEPILDNERATVVQARLLAVFVVSCLGVWLLTLAPVFSFEGPWFGHTYTAAVLLVHALVAPKLIAVWYRWGLLSDRLDELARRQQAFVTLIAPTGADSQKKDEKDGAEAAHPLNLPRFSPGQLFKSPRLPEVERLCDEYADAVAKAPQILEKLGVGLETIRRKEIARQKIAHQRIAGDDTTRREAATERKGRKDLHRLLELTEVLSTRWQLRPAETNVEEEEARAASFNPLVLFAAIDKHAFDPLFAQTLALGDRAERARTHPAFAAARAGVEVADAVTSGDDLDRERAMLAASWRTELQGRLPGGATSLEVGEAMLWLASQPEAKDARALVATLPVLPPFVRSQLDDDRRLSDKLPASISRAWDALSWIASLLVTSGVMRSYDPTSVEHKAIARFLALHLFTSIRLALWQIWKALAFVMAAILLVMVSHLVYPIQPRGLMIGVAATEVLIAVALAVRAMFAVERNAILSRLTGGNAGQIDWSWGLAARLVAWAVVPIAGVVATRFPDIGDVILRVFSPFESFMR